LLWSLNGRPAEARAVWTMAAGLWLPLVLVALTSALILRSAVGRGRT
jgi:hypothetical protein